MRRETGMVVLKIFVGMSVLSSAHYVSAEVGGPKKCHVVQRGQLAELDSPFFEFRVDTAAGLRAQSWSNLLTGRTLALGNGPELDIDIGLPDQPLQTPIFAVSDVRIARRRIGRGCFSALGKSAGDLCDGRLSLGRKAARAAQVCHHQE